MSYQRMETVAPVFGQTKPGQGFRQFPWQGLERVRGEWSLICATTTCSNCSAALNGYNAVQNVEQPAGRRL